MGVSLYVIGIKPPDDKWKKMAAVHRACTEAGIAPPALVTQFFDGETPDRRGGVVDLEKHDAVTKYNDGKGSVGYEVTLADLPPDVKVLRFYVTW